MERIEFEKLDKLVVEDVMNKNIPTLNKTDTLREALKLLINHPFVCEICFSSHFEGILTRRVILKQLNAFVHKMHFQE